MQARETIERMTTEREADKGILYNKFVYGFLFYTFFIYPTTSTAIFNYFDYDIIADEAGDDICYLSVDYTTRCDNSREYDRWAIYAICFMMFISGMGQAPLYPGKEALVGSWIPLSELSFGQVSAS